VSTNCVLTEAVATDAAARTFACDGLTPAVCGANVVVAASTVSPCSLMTVTAANNVVSFARKSGLTSYLGPVVSSAVGVTAQNGVDGMVTAGGGVIGSYGFNGGIQLGAGGYRATCNAGGECAFVNAAGTAYTSVFHANALDAFSGYVKASGYVRAGTYVLSDANATLGNCAAAGDVGKWISYSKASKVYPCYCKQTGAGTYAWVPMVVGDDCT
jgi:hypothetical protein